MMNKWVLSNGTVIYQILGGRSNVYLIKNQTLNYLIDTAKTGARRKLIRRLKKLKVSNIDWLLLTHAHFDHCQNAAFLKKEFGCKIAANINASSLIAKGYSPLPEGTLRFSRLIIFLAKSLKLRIGHYISFSPDLYFNKEWELETKPATIELIHTPGHSIDSSTIIVNREIALVGDTMFGIFPNHIIPPFADDKNQMISSWQHLEKYGCHTFLPGHGKKISKQRVKNELKQYRN